jgi:hypothetical protein
MSSVSSPPISDRIDDIMTTKPSSPCDVDHIEMENNLPSSTWLKTNDPEFYQEALEKYGFDGSIDPEVERKLVRKIDWLVLPW